MLNIFIGSALDPMAVIVNPNSTIREIYAANRRPIPQGALVTMDARRLGDAELDKPISTLGAVEGAMITISEKLQGA